MKKISIHSIIVCFLILCCVVKIAQNGYQNYVENMKNIKTNNQTTKLDFTKNNAYVVDFDLTETNYIQNKNPLNIKIKDFKTKENIINVEINHPTPLSYKTKKEVYDLRKKYVKKSIFDIPNYEPSDEVFGGIEDNKPWISTNRVDIKNQELEISKDHLKKVDL